MDVSRFDFDLPRASIALRPARPRDAARMLEVEQGALTDLGILQLPSRLRRGDIVVFNDTRVIPARLEMTRAAARGTAKVEITFNRAQGPGLWNVFARPAKRLKPGDTVAAEGLSATVVRRGEGGEVLIDVSVGKDVLFAVLDRAGQVPLPPYMARDPDEADRVDYQTMFASVPGAVAAPTAALHFTPRLLDALDAAGIVSTFVTLHVGAGTFLPVTAEDTDTHRMHPEWGEVSENAAEAVAAARARGGNVVAIGTTVLRLLESAAQGGSLRPFLGETSLFITPGYRFRSVDRLLTNFHLPRSTLFMLVCAFSGTERMQAVYAHARDSGYRFYSYGDCSLLHPE